MSAKAKTTMAERAAMAFKQVPETPAPTPEKPSEPVVGEEPAAPAAAPVKRKTTPTRADDIRLSVGVSPKIYHKLVTYTNVLAMNLGVARIPHVQVIRELLEELETNQDLQEKVATRVTERYESK